MQKKIAIKSQKVLPGIGNLKNFAGAGPPGPLFLLGLGRVEAFFGPGAGPYLGIIWATFFGNFAESLLGHIWAISYIDLFVIV